MISTADISQFLTDISAIHARGNATEHSYRPAIKTLIETTADIIATNEPKREACGAPDFIIEQGDIPLGHIEAKDIEIDIRPRKGPNKEQQDRYIAGLPNLIYTNGLDWDFYREGERIASVTIGDVLMGIQPRPENFDQFAHLLQDFVTARPQTITSAAKLAKMMAGRATLIKDVMGKALREDADLQTELAGQYRGFKEQLIHDISPDEFADIYAETIAYGMFAARLHDPTVEDFSRQEALELLPKTNPFLRNLFSYIAGPTLDDRIRWIIDELALVFQACDLAKLMANFGSLTKRNDPFIHFYEDFLKEYNPKKRKARGVWYTPEPVVNFIVRAVDEVLQKEFGLADGLADTSKVTVDWDTGFLDKKGKPITNKREVHRVQILDPATGTGTFLAEVIKQIAPRVKGIAEGMWSGYIERDLIPRLHGFELLMASYAMCHMKLDMILTELGYKPTGQPPRLSVYLTNSLEEGEREVRDLFMAQWLTNEARAANNIKRQQPIMCVIGNPPYNIMSGNLSDEQIQLVEPFRYVDGNKIKEKGMLQFEKNINNDYIKFIALAERILRKTGYGILGFVTSHGYLKSSSFRGLRSHLLDSFDRVYVLDLHGNSEIREVPPADITDENVFEIKQGVAILICVKVKKSSSQKGKVYFSELWGSRRYKGETLYTKSFGETDWVDCGAVSPNYIFHPSGPSFSKYVEEAPSLADFFPIYSSGVITARDGFSISENSQILTQRIQEFASNVELSDSELCNMLDIPLKKGWDISRARASLRNVQDRSSLIREISYRPFDDRKIIFHESVV